MTNQDHDTPTEAGEPIPADAAGAAASEAEPADGAADPGIGATGSSAGQTGASSVTADARDAQATHATPAQYGYDSRYGYGGQPSDGSPDPGTPSREPPDYGYGPSYEYPGLYDAERHGDPNAPYAGPGSPYAGPRSPHASPRSTYVGPRSPHAGAGSAHDDQGSAHSGSGAAHSGSGAAHSGSGAAHGEQRRPSYGLPGSAYGDQEPAHGPVGAAYSDQAPPAHGGPGQSPYGAGNSYTNPEPDGGLDYADPRYYSSAPPYYADPPVGQLHAPTGALAPLPPRWTDQPPRETAESLTPESLLPTKKPPPPQGWRRTVYRMTAGLIRPGESQAELRRHELIYRARTPVAGGHHRVAVMSLKGGVGKTTTAVGLGAMLASLRGDRVIAVDANPDRGTLSDKVRLETAATVRDLLNERAQIQRYADVRAFTSQAPSRLELLASDRDPAVSVAFSETDYYDVAHVLEHYYSVCITDCGTGLLHSAMAGVLQLADQIVLVSSPSVDGARSASATLDWLEAHDYGDLVRNAVVVLSIIRPRSKSTVDIDRLEQHFAARCRAVARIPYDPHLEEGAEVDLELMNPETADAYLMLGATVGDGFAWPRRLRAAAS